jgi:hypothetical protein
MKHYRPENYHGRPDWRTRAIVDAAIELRKRDGTLRAAQFLARQNVPLAVALRVFDLQRLREPL